MAYFTVTFEKVDSVEVVVEAADEGELERAIEGTLEEGLDSWYFEEGDWECTSRVQCGKQFDPVKSEASGELHGIDRSNPECWQIVAYCDRSEEPQPDLSDDEVHQCFFREAEEAGQLALALNSEEAEPDAN